MNSEKKFEGIVQKGSRRGTALGFPTVNIPLTAAFPPGIYAALVKVGEEEYEAAAFVDSSRRTLEAHLLDFDADLYGWRIVITLMHKLRDNKVFRDDAAARKEIASDVERARTYFLKRGGSVH